MKEEFKPLNAAVRQFAIPQNLDEEGSQASIDMVQHPKEGGIYTWLRGFRHPFYGFPEKEKVLAIGDIKQFVPIIVRFCFRQPMKTFVGILFLISPKLFNKIAARVMSEFLIAAHNTFQRYYMDPIRYTNPIREIHRTLTKVSLSTALLDLKGIIERIRDIGCLICQFDNAYILRLQDILGVVDPVKFKIDPMSEIRKAMVVVAEREDSIEMKQKIGWLIELFCMFLKYNKDYHRILCAFAKVVDIDKLKLSEADKYYCRKRPDYDFSGHRKNKDKFFGLPSKLELIMEEAILQRLQTRKAVIQQEFNNIVQEREKLIMEERRAEDAKQQRDKQIAEYEKSAEVLRGRWAEVTEEEGQLLELKKTDEEQKDKEKKDKKESQTKDEK